MFRWILLIAEVNVRIIGANFLWHFKLVVNVRHSCLMDSETHLPAQGVTSRLPPLPLVQAHAKSPHGGLRFSRNSVIGSKLLRSNTQYVTVTDYILTVGAPVFERPRRLAPVCNKLARQEFEYVLFSSGTAAPHLGPGHHY